MKSRKGIVRLFEEKDRKLIRAICRQTGQKGNPARLFFEDEEIVPMIFADYYMDYEPESCLVAEVDGRVVGYMLACKDTRRCNRVLLTRIYPRVCLRILLKIFTFQYREKQTYKTLWWIISRSWREAFHPPLEKYPGHAHFNIESAYRGLGLGQRLSLATRQHMCESGIRGSHCLIREEERDDKLSTFLCRESGYKILNIKRSTVWEKVTGKKWYAKLLVRDLCPGSEGDHDASSEH